MKINELRDNPGAHKKRRRVGRGIGSTKGKTCGSGGKGQTARSGVSIHGFQGGQTPLYRILPKRGFTNIFRKKYAEINLKDLQKAVEKGIISSEMIITEEILKNLRLVKHLYDGVRLLGEGSMKQILHLHLTSASKGAIAAIENSGGTIKFSCSNLQTTYS